jgi:hypothetical protein
VTFTAYLGALVLEPGDWISVSWVDGSGRSLFGGTQSMMAVKATDRGADQLVDIEARYPKFVFICFLRFDLQCSTSGGRPAQHVPFRIDANSRAHLMHCNFFATALRPAHSPMPNSRHTLTQLIHDHLIASGKGAISLVRVIGRV